MVHMPTAYVAKKKNLFYEIQSIVAVKCDGTVPDWEIL